MDRREELLGREEEGWRELTDLIDAVPAERLDGAGLNPEGWSVKDLMWHVARWAGTCADVLDRIRTGASDGGPLEEDADAVNRRWFEESRRLDLATVRAAWLGSRARMRERFCALDPLTPEAEEWFDESGPLHYAAHLPELRRWVAQADPGP
jgi:hypothetical protein